MSLTQEIEAWVTALDHFDQQDYDVSLLAFSDIANTSKILFNCGIIYATLGQHELAIEHYQRAIQLDRYLAIAYFQQGVSNFLLGDYEEALANFNDALLYLRCNRWIDYHQLGLDFKLHSCEVLFNRGLCAIYTQQHDSGMQDLFYASKEKSEPSHDVIDEAIKERAIGYTVFSIPVGLVYRPNPAKVKNLRRRDYMGQARVVAQQPTLVQQKPLLTQDMMPKDQVAGGSFAATNLVRGDLASISYRGDASSINSHVGQAGPSQRRPRNGLHDASGLQHGHPQINQSNSSPLDPITSGHDHTTAISAVSLQNLSRSGCTRVPSSPIDPIPPFEQVPKLISPRKQLSLRTSPRTLTRSPFFHDPNTPYTQSTATASTSTSNYSHPFRSNSTASTAAIEYSSPSTSASTTSPDSPRKLQSSASPTKILPFRSVTSTHVQSPRSSQSQGENRTLAERRAASRTRGSAQHETLSLPGVRHVRVKLHTAQATRYLQLSAKTTFDELRQLVCAKLGQACADGDSGTSASAGKASARPAGAAACRIKVRDDDGDIITLGDAEDWDLALEGAVGLALQEWEKGRVGAEGPVAKLDVWASLV